MNTIGTAGDFAALSYVAPKYCVNTPPAFVGVVAIEGCESLIVFPQCTDFRCGPSNGL